MNEVEVKKRKKSGGFKKFVSSFKTICTICFIIGLVCLFIFFSLRSTEHTKTTKLGFEDVGELVTQTCYVTVLEDSKVNRDFFNLFVIPFTESRQIFSYDFEVDASINFSEITYDVVKEEKKIVITVPNAKIYKTRMNTKSLKVYLDTDNLFSRIDLNKHNDVLKVMEKQATEDCKANNILDAANQNAQTLISGFVKSNNDYKDYNIIYKFKGGK